MVADGRWVGSNSNVLRLNIGTIMGEHWDNHGYSWIYHDLPGCDGYWYLYRIPSSSLLHNYGASPSSIGQSWNSMGHGFQSELLNYQMVYVLIGNSYTIIYHHIPSYTIIHHHIPSYTIIYHLGYLWPIPTYLWLPAMCWCGDGDTTETVSGQQFTAIAFASECFSQSQPFGRYPTKVEPCRTSWHTMAYHGEVSENWGLTLHFQGFESSFSWIFQDHCGTEYRILQSHMGGLCHGSPGQFTWDS